MEKWEKRLSMCLRSEPLDEEHPFRSYDQIVLGAHNGSNTREAILRANQTAIDILMRFLREAAIE